MSFYMSKVSITQIGFALLCIGSVFMYSTQITDPYIVIIKTNKIVYNHLETI